MAIKSGDFVKVNFTGKLKDNDQVFDTTSEDVAKDSDIYSDKRTYEPIDIIIGANHLFPAIEKEIEELNVGDSKTIEVACEDAVGPRNNDLIRIIPMKDFKKQGITPYQGMQVNYENQIGVVLSVKSGRVRVDFNHELAGKDLVYDIEIMDIIEEDEDKIKSIIKLFYPSKYIDMDKTKLDIDGKTLNITLDEISKFLTLPYSDITSARLAISKNITEYMDFDQVNFIDSFDKSFFDGEEN